MLLKTEILDKIRTGVVTTVFRRWNSARVRAGGTLRTSVGVLAIDEVCPADVDEVTESDARNAGFGSLADLLADVDRGRHGTLYRISLRWQSDDPRVALRLDDRVDDEQFRRLHSALRMLDVRDLRGDWTIAALTLILERDGITAREIADRLGYEKAALKLKIRKLKELGLTESLSSGYRLSPRGAAFLRKTW